MSAGPMKLTSSSKDWWCCIASVDDKDGSTEQQHQDSDDGNDNDCNNNNIRLWHVSSLPPPPQQHADSSLTTASTDENDLSQWIQSLQSIEQREQTSSSLSTGRNNMSSSQQPDLQHQHFSAKVLDVTKAPDWMEYIEYVEHRSTDCGGAGAYDALRCDLVIIDATTKTTSGGTITKHHVWGLDFHIQRLQVSYQALVAMSSSLSNNNNKNETETRKTTTTTASLHRASMESKQMLHMLIREAEQALLLRPGGATAITSNTGDCNRLENDKQLRIYMLRLTLLWSPPLTTSNNDNDTGAEPIITVRGHACFCWTTTLPMALLQSNDTNNVGMESIIWCSLAAHRNDDVNGQIVVDTTLPSRYLLDSATAKYSNNNNPPPHVKVAAWTRQRQILEEPLQYKPQHVSEVLMVRPVPSIAKQAVDVSSSNNDDVELLEGLSSNIFVIYRDGTVHTAPQGVLLGYVRHRVLEACHTLGYRVDVTHPILLSEVPQWKEAFITSSTRLIYPIAKILLRHNHLLDGTTEFCTFWQDPILLLEQQQQLHCLNNNERSSLKEKPQWQCIYQEILRSEGY